MSTRQGFFQDFLLGPFLQRRLSLNWYLYSINVVETECVKAGALRDTINWLKMANALFFLCCEMNSSHFLLNFRVFNWKLICTRHEFNLNSNTDFILLHRIVWWEDWVSKLNSRLSFWKSLKKPCVHILQYSVPTTLFFEVYKACFKRRIFRVSNSIAWMQNSTSETIEFNVSNYGRPWL